MNFEQFRELAGHSDRVLVDGYEYDHMRFTIQGIVFEDNGDTNALTFDALNFEQAKMVGDSLEIDDDNGYIRLIKCIKIQAPVVSNDDRFANGIIEIDEDDPSEKLYGNKAEKE